MFRSTKATINESALDDPNYDPVTIMTKTLDELQNFKGGELEKRVFIFCMKPGMKTR